MYKSLLPVLIAGLLSSGLFLLVFGMGLGFVFMFLPTLPLFSLGLSKQPRMALHGALVAAVILAIAGGLPSGLLYLVFLALPTCYIIRYSLLSQTAAGEKQWFPLGLIFLHLTLYAVIVVNFTIAYYAGQEGGLPHLLAQNIHEAFADLQQEYGDVIDALASNWSFLIFSITIWLWGMALYAHGWLANRALARKHLEQRPDFEMRVFDMPDWMLPLMGICALASLIGSESMRFAGQTTLISLLLPYFFLGATLVHTVSQKWPNRRFFLFLIYFMVLAQFWPALFIAGMGLWHHIKSLNKRLPAA